MIYSRISVLQIKCFLWKLWNLFRKSIGNQKPNVLKGSSMNIPFSSVFPKFLLCLTDLKIITLNSVRMYNAAFVWHINGIAFEVFWEKNNIIEEDKLWNTCHVSAFIKKLRFTIQDCKNIISPHRVQMLLSHSGKNRCCVGKVWQLKKRDGKDYSWDIFT